MKLVKLNLKEWPWLEDNVQIQRCGYVFFDLGISPRYTTTRVRECKSIATGEVIDVSIDYLIEEQTNNE